MAGRPTKLTPALRRKVVKALETGATIEDVCAHVGIGVSTFYLWLEIGRAAAEDTPHERLPESEADQKPFVEFVEAVTRAQAAAKMAAITALRTAMSPHSQTSKTVETYTETRINKHTGDPYEYRQETVRETVTVFAGDWRAGVEYLKRRHFDEWGDKSKAEHTGPDGGPIQTENNTRLDVSGWTDEQLRLFAESLKG